MSKDITDRYKLLESVARKESTRDEDIQNFAESTMNELLAWYGYGDKVMRHADHTTTATPNASRDESSDPRSKSRFLCNVTEALDTTPPDHLGQPISDSDRGGAGIPKRSPSSSSGSQRHKDQFTRDVSSHSLDSTHSLVAARHCRPDSVNSMASTDSTESNLLASTKVPTREASDHTQNHQRHPAAMTKMKKVCDWCRQVPPSISLADSVDGLNQLSFCSELCLNHYKMNLFCTETRQYLQQIQNSEDAGDVAAVAASDNKILITPELWMAEKKKKMQKTATVVEESKRCARFNENQMETRADDSNYRLLDTPSEREDDVGRHSDCGSNVDTSNGMEFVEYLDAQRKHKRKKEEFNFKVGCLNSEVSSETSLDVGKCTTTARCKSFETCENNSAVVHGVVEERFSDGESGRRGKRLKTSSSKEAAVSPASSSYPASASVAGSWKKCLEAQEGLLSVPAKDLGSSYSSPGSSRVRGGRSVRGGDVFPLLHHLSSDLSNDPTQFRRASDASSNLVERSKSNVPAANCLTSQQGKSNNPPQFSNSPLFGSSAPLPPNSLFSSPGIPSLMHLLGPTLNPQFLGGGPTVPPSFPFLGLPSLFSMPGGGGGGASVGGGGGTQVPPGIPVPPSMTNPWSNLLPPNTLMIPYPVLLPLPIPIPIPFPVPSKCGQTKGSGGGGETADNGSSRQNDNGKADLREDVKDRPGDLRCMPSTKNQDKSGDSSSSFPGHTIVCTCCRLESAPGRTPHDPHSRSNFCSPCRSKGDVQHSTGFTDNLNDVPALFAAAAAAAAAAAPVASQNLAIDFSMARDSKGSMRSPSLHGTNSFVATPSSSVTIKTEPLDLAISGENNNLSSSSPSSSSSLMMMKSSCELQSLAPSLPYLARRSLILDAPSVSKEKPVNTEKHFTDASSKKFMYCKRRYPSLHIKTK